MAHVGIEWIEHGNYYLGSRVSGLGSWGCQMRRNGK